MKLSEFRKLIREEVRIMVNETNARDLLKYFKEAGIPLSPQFSIEKMSTATDIDKKSLLVLLQNLEDRSVMKDISKGNYKSFDVYDSSQFNDSYDDMVDDLGLDSDEGNTQTTSSKITYAVVIDLDDVVDTDDVMSLKKLKMPNSIKSLVGKPKPPKDPEDWDAHNEEVERYMDAVLQALVDVGQKVVPGIRFLAGVGGEFHLKLPAKPTPKIMSKLKSLYSGAKSVTFASA